MKKFLNWTNLRLMLMILILGGLLSFTTHRNNNRKLLQSTVEFLNEEPLFVTHETVNKLLIENKKHASSIQKVALDLNNLERTINKHQMIENAEVYVTVDGHLKAVVKQKTPVARLFEGRDSYYIDSKGTKMPLSDNYSARVPLVLGSVEGENRENFITLFRLIHQDDFLKKNIIGIEILPNGSVKMKNRNFDFVIDFGKPVSVEKKLNNYKAFFQKAVQDSLLEKYKIINLKFTQQVVCTK